MLFPKLFNKTRAFDLSKRSVAVRSLVEKTLAYLRKRAAENPSAQIRPSMLAQVIGENGMIALTALRILEKAGITKSHIRLYCAKTEQYMGQAEPGQSLPETLPCDACERQEHDLDSGTMRSEIFFTFDPVALAQATKVA
jgi:ribosomal protein S25